MDEDDELWGSRTLKPTGKPAYSDDDDLWASGASVSKSSSQSLSTSDLDLWGRKSTTKQSRVQQSIVPIREVNSRQELVSALREGIAGLMLEVVSPGKAQTTLAVTRKELDHIFLTWRRPHLLLEYHHMYASSAEMQQLIKRFLRALIAASDETVDDIRYRDFHNLKHFRRLPPALARAWRDGYVMIPLETDNGQVQNPTKHFLPGYTDAQTLFMLGEDANTCMSIRPRLKSSNRGLLSFLLCGNCRVVGKKDELGRLKTRAVVRLLVDQTTNAPVLYVHKVLGRDDISSQLEVSGRRVILPCAH